MKTIERREVLKFAVLGLLELTGCANNIKNVEAATVVPTRRVSNPTLLPTRQPTKIEPTPTIADCPTILFNDDFDANNLYKRWDVFEGRPAVGEGRLTLSGAVNIQSISSFNGGILEGNIQSYDWNSNEKFTDSSFGFEMWKGKCHYGILFKTNGHLAVLSSEPGTTNDCVGDPKNQDYQAIPNWEIIRAGKDISFKLTWEPNKATLWVRGNYVERQVVYSGIAIPNVPQKIRLYVQDKEKYKIDNIHLCSLSK